jgi:hypothetical protein
LSDSAFSSSGDEGDGCTARGRPPPLLDPLELPGADDVRTGGCGDSEDETTQATAPLPSGDDAAHILLMLGSGGSGGARTCAFCATGEVAPLSGPEACVLWRCQLCGQQACHEQCCKGRIEGVWGADLGAPKHACPTCCEKHKVAVQAEANTLRKELEAAVADVVAREPLATRLAALRQRERGLASDDALALLQHSLRLVVRVARRQGIAPSPGVDKYLLAQVACLRGGEMLRAQLPQLTPPLGESEPQCEVAPHRRVPLGTVTAVELRLSLPWPRTL